MGEVNVLELASADHCICHVDGYDKVDLVAYFIK